MFYLMHLKTLRDSEGHVWKTQSYDQNQWGKTKKVPFRIRNKSKRSTLATVSQYCTKKFQPKKLGKKKIEVIQIAKKGIRLSLVTDDKIILYIKVPENNNKKKLLEIIPKFSKVADHEIKQKIQYSFYTPAIPFIIVPKIINYMPINLI